jgi:hypothetical protein
MENHKPKTLNEIKAIRRPVRNANIETKQKLSRLDNLALWITKHVGTMGFFFINNMLAGLEFAGTRTSMFRPFPCLRAVAVYLKHDTNIPDAAYHDRAEPAERSC